MATLKKTISINAPVEQVYGYMAEPTHLPEIWPSMEEVKNVKKTPDGAVDSYDWKYKMAGMHFEGSTQVKEYITNQRTVAKNEKGIPSTFVWTYQPEGNATKLTVEVEYTIPVPLLGKLAETFIVKQNEHEAETMLANLKARMESQ